MKGNGKQETQRNTVNKVENIKEQKEKENSIHTAKNDISRPSSPIVIDREGSKEDLAHLYSKLADATAEIINLEKNGYNKYHKYEYAKADDIYLSVSKILAEKYNIQILTSPSRRKVSRFSTDNGTYTEIFLEKRFSFNCGDTGAYIELEYWGYDMGKSGKFLYKAYTGCMKYFLKDNFMIDTGDPDPEMDKISGGNGKVKDNNKNNSNNTKRKDESFDKNQSNEKNKLTAREEKIKAIVGSSEELRQEMINYLSHIKEENDLEKVSLDALTDKQFHELISVLKDIEGIIDKSA